LSYIGLTLLRSGPSVSIALREITDPTQQLAGVALGHYSLTQACQVHPVPCFHSLPPSTDSSSSWSVHKSVDTTPLHPPCFPSSIFFHEFPVPRPHTELQFTLRLPSQTSPASASLPRSCKQPQSVSFVRCFSFISFGAASHKVKWTTRRTTRLPIDIQLDDPRPPRYLLGRPPTSTQ